MGTGADPEIVQADARGCQACYLFEQGLGVDHTARADDIAGGWVEDAAGDQVQGVLAEFVDDCMARVVAPLKTDDHIGLLGQIINNASFAFIAPLGAHNCGDRHGGILSDE
jgi:hypothetical protein